MKDSAQSYILPYIGNFTISSSRVERDRPIIDEPDKAADLWNREILTSPFIHSDKESVVVLACDQRLRAMGWHHVSMGTLNDANCHPREVCRPLLIAGAAAFFLMHNHPSGVPLPSELDKKATRRVMAAAEILGLYFADHVIVGEDGEYYSFREHSFFDEDQEQNGSPPQMDPSAELECRVQRLEAQIGMLASKRRASSSSAKAANLQKCLKA